MEPEYTSVRITSKSAKTYREFCNRTQTSLVDFFNLLAEQLQLQLDLMESNKRLLWMADFDPKNRMTHIRISDALMTSFDQIDPEMKTEILKAFGYDERFHDLRERPPIKQPEQQPKPQPNPDNRECPES